MFRPGTIRLILVYGPQEGDAKNDIEDFYENLQIQLLDKSFTKRTPVPGFSWRSS